LRSTVESIKFVAFEFKSELIQLLSHIEINLYSCLR
jgi:hypothetical protein